MTIQEKIRMWEQARIAFNEPLADSWAKLNTHNPTINGLCFYFNMEHCIDNLFSLLHPSLTYEYLGELWWPIRAVRRNLEDMNKPDTNRVAFCEKQIELWKKDLC